MTSSAPRFFYPLAITPADVGGEVALPDAVAHHAVRVLRLAAGDTVRLFTGRGGEFVATIVRADRRDAVVRLERFEAVERETPLEVSIVQAVLAADAMDSAVRRMVELGAHAIQPVIAARTNAAPRGERADKRLAHWRQIAIAACEQCGRNRVPEIAPALGLAPWLEAREPDPEHPVAMLLPEAGESLAALAGRAPPHFVLVGPEGGFTSEEAAHAMARGARAVHLGARILRAETAGPAALAALNALCGDAR